MVTRTYYRNTFFHIGHIKTMLDNERIARKYNGVCYAIIDDRQDPSRITSIKEDFDYLELTHIKAVSVREYHSQIMKHTYDLINKRMIYLCHCVQKETNPERIIKFIEKPTEHFQLRLNCGSDNGDPSIGYTSPNDKGYLELTMIFDYIIKILDRILGVTDIISTSLTEVNDVKDEQIASFFDDGINHHRLDTYHIYNFKYSKRGWNITNGANPYLLTFKGMRCRHIPSIVLKAFYIHASQMGYVKIKQLGDLLSLYLSQHSSKTLGVVNPLKVIVDNWHPKRTEYACSYTDRGLIHYPLSNILYIDNDSFGIDKKVNIGKSIYLMSGPTLHCTNVDVAERRSPVLHALLEEDTHKMYGRDTVNWISSVWDTRPCLVRFYMYNWFYTGNNSLLSPEILDGYIEQSVFSDLDQVYQIINQGYFIYDRELSAKNKIPTFIRICKF